MKKIYSFSEVINKMCMYKLYDTPLSFIDEQGKETRIILNRDWEGGFEISTNLENILQESSEK